MWSRALFVVNPCHNYCSTVCTWAIWLDVSLPTYIPVLMGTAQPDPIPGTLLVSSSALVVVPMLERYMFVCVYVWQESKMNSRTTYEPPRRNVRLVDTAEVVKKCSCQVQLKLHTTVWTWNEFQLGHMSVVTVRHIDIYSVHTYIRLDSALKKKKNENDTRKN